MGNTLKFKRDSFVVNMATQFGFLSEYEFKNWGVDSCLLAKSFCLGVAFYTLSTIVISTIGYYILIVLGDVIGWISAMILNLSFIETPYSSLIIYLVFLFSMAGVIMLFGYILYKIFGVSIKGIKHGISKTSEMKLIESFRNKYCLKIELED